MLNVASLAPVVNLNASHLISGTANEPQSAPAVRAMFLRECSKSGIEPTKRQARKFLREQHRMISLVSTARLS